MGQIKSVVVVEDERETADMLTEMLNLIGFRGHACYGGSLAMTTIYKTKPDAVLLDMMMPDLSGLDILRSMHNDTGLSQIPVIIISARTTPEDINKGMEAGACHYLTKPVSILDLKAAVEHALQGTTHQ